LISAVVLAAGQSVRFGGKKQTALLGSATLVGRVLESVSRSKVHEVVLVAGQDEEELTRGLDPGIRVVRNARSREGMSTSLQLGLASISPDSAGAIVLLADQPFVSAGLVDRLIERYRRKRAKIVAAFDGAVVSPPVLIDRSLFPKLRRLSGEAGAKAVIRGMAAGEVEYVRARPNELMDIDTREDLDRAREALLTPRREGRRRVRGAGSA
jgi:molybdenum cofactor cytidylyltransferase